MKDDRCNMDRNRGVSCEDGIMVIHDFGHGVTRQSTEQFEKYISDIQPIEVNVRNHGEFTFELFGVTRDNQKSVIILESGFNCGYGGEGPHGTADALKKLGVDDADLKEIFVRDNLTFDFRSGKPKLE